MRKRVAYRTDDELRDEIMRCAQLFSERRVKRGILYPAIRTRDIVDWCGYSRMTNRLLGIVEEICEDNKLVRVDTYYAGAAGVVYSYYLPKYVPVNMRMPGF